MSTDNRTWLSKGAEALAARPPHGGNRWDCDVLIVGSGYGGAVAAAEMAGSMVTEVGGETRLAEVWVLERGLEHLPGRFPSRFSEVAGSVRFSLQDGQPARGNAEGLFDIRLGPDMSVLLGSGLGGGSLINSGVMECPEPVVFEKGWPRGITWEGLQGYFNQAATGLGAAQFPGGIRLPKLQVMDELAARQQAGSQAHRCHLTVHCGPDPLQENGCEIKPCTQCGDCLTGCNVGAKRSLDTSYLAVARTRGAKLYCGGFAERIEPYPSAGYDHGGWKVLWHLTEPAHRPPCGTPNELYARHVVLAAGALGSTEILMRSMKQEPSLRFSKTLGRSFSGNGDMIVAARGHGHAVEATGREQVDPTEFCRQVGPTISGSLRFSGGNGFPSFLVEDFAVPAALRLVYGEVTALLEILANYSTMASQTGGDRFAVSDYGIERTSLFGLIIEEDETGTLSLPMPEGGVPALESGIRIVFPTWAQSTAADKAAQSFSSKLKGLQLPPSAPRLPGEPIKRLPVCTHPIGGCGMADAVEGGVVDVHGRVFIEGASPGGAAVYPGLAVLDGSVLPRALGINPALTIAALALQAAPRLMEDWGFQKSRPGAGQPPDQLVGPRPLIRRPFLPAPRAMWSIRELQTGRLTGPPWAGCLARLDIRFAPVESFRHWLAESAPLRLTLDSRHCTLTLTDPADACAARHSVQGSVQLFVRSPGEQTAPSFKIVYELTAAPVDPTLQHRCCLPKGTRVRGEKMVDPYLFTAPNDYRRSMLRQLSEIELFLGGEPAGRLALDLDDLADREEALLRALELSSMPAALEDLGAIGLFLLRHLASLLGSRARNFESLIQGRPEGSLADLARKRRPTTVDGQEPQQHALRNGAVLWRYAVPSGVTPKGVPVLLIHGLAMGANSFTHDALPGGGLAAFLLRKGREVWVLDLRSSIANEAGRQLEASADWTVELVAKDIPLAIRRMVREGIETLDVFAHCFGGVMFCQAALTQPDLMGRHVRSAVLSQVGPLLRLSPMNRLRGFLATYLWRQGRVEEFDCVPDPAGVMGSWIDALCSLFPYPDEDDECKPVPARQWSDLIRYRADMIFGQMYESRNVSQAARDHLAELLGWVKAPMLAQTIHFARQSIVTDATGRNTRMKRAGFDIGFNFPVLILHGRNNRVFDWRGGLDSLNLLRKLRVCNADPINEVQGERDGIVTRFGVGPTSLVVIDGYGHLDAVIGKDAVTQVYPLVTAFFDEQGTDTSARMLPPLCPDQSLLPQIERPWIGPVLGALSWRGEGEWLDVCLQVHGAPRRAAMESVVIVPICECEGAPQPQLEEACEIMGIKRGRRQLSLSIRAEKLREPGIKRFAVLTLHRDMPLKALLMDGVHKRGRNRLSPRQWLETRFDRQGDEQGFDLETWGRNAGLHLTPRPDAETESSWLSGRLGLDVSKPDPASVRALQGWFAASRSESWREVCFTLTTDTVEAAAAPRFKRHLSFALASCQYPAGVLDRVPAMASYKRLLDAIEMGGADKAPQFLIQCGDQVYLDSTAGVFDPAAVLPLKGVGLLNDLERNYQLAWRLPEARAVMSALPVVALTDDHEVRNNYGGRGWDPCRLEQPMKAFAAAALRAARQYQARVGGRRRLGGAGSRSYVWCPGGLPFFMLDTRTQRELRTPANVCQARLLPDQVIEGLVARLRRLPAHLPKFIVSTTPLLPPQRFHADAVAERIRSDGWSGFPHSASLLMNAILTHEIRGVVLLSGDLHFSSVCRFTFDRCKDLSVVSVVSSGLYTPWPFANDQPDDYVLEGPVRIGLLGPVGKMECLQQTTEAGFAVIGVKPAVGGGAARLHVSFRLSDGGRMEVDEPVGFLVPPSSTPEFEGNCHATRDATDSRVQRGHPDLVADQ